MKQRILIGFAVLALLALSMPGLALAHSTTQVATSAVYGPFAAASADSGTCASWANDTYNRLFTIEDTSITSPDATHPVTVREDFQNAAFSTLAGASPGACQNGTSNGSTVGASVHGVFSGYELFVVTAGTLNTASTPCSSSACQGSGSSTNSAAVTAFMTALYGASEAFTTPTYNLSYDAGDNGQWRDASTDQGGNLGDITGIFISTGKPGPIGPAGPQGVQGPIGLTGIQGLQGATGLSGLPFAHVACTEVLTGSAQQENLVFCQSGIEDNGGLVYKAAINAATHRIIVGTPISSNTSVDWNNTPITYVAFTSGIHAEYHADNVVHFYNAANQRVF